MIDPALLTRLQAILPGEWTAIRDGYALATPAGALAVTTPYSQYLVRIGDGDGDTCQVEQRVGGRGWVRREADSCRKRRPCADATLHGHTALHQPGQSA